MIKIDKDALLCDLAETYQIYDFRQLPLTTVAVFSCGLSEDSRIKMKINNQKVKLDQIILMNISDTLKLLLWSKTKDGQKGRNKPAMWTSLLEKPKVKNEIVFDSSEDFERKRAEILGKRGTENGD